ncbi:uncharacterized protein EV422DRAFT_571681 [Fimicolochytrium jonesii]|uniref:uncharacterized protein n=1 Tax=Fimicolochytrium jonesii TaxID=1396493 RepID=UPI0022FDB52B|nr:uncharacterized protein EV422DRAFT_571681 [Fimicolochytrium jonesii]KAI8816501.1 hypothetical protein EV422DRAFT_571681 [Fimicolochytrium jonesii]
MTLAEETPLEAFRTWLLQNGATMPALDFKPSLEGSAPRGTGLFTQIPLSLAAEETIANVPSHLLINSDLVLRISRGDTPAARRLKKCLASLEAVEMSVSQAALERLFLLVFLLWGWSNGQVDEEEEDGGGEELDGEKKRLSAGFWLPYIRILPDLDDLDTPIFWPESSPALALLQGTPLATAVAAKKNKLNREFGELKPHLQHLQPPGVTITEQRFLWADAVFWSRVLSLGSALQIQPDVNENAASPDDYHLIPLIDLCNHSPDASIRWNISSSPSSSPSPVIDLRAVNDTTLPENTELFISYGAKPNTEFLFLHGFVIPSNPHNALVVSPVPFIESTYLQTEDDDLPDVDQTAIKNAIQEKMELLARLGVPPMIYLSPPTGDVTDETLSEIGPHTPDPTCGIVSQEGMVAMYVAVLTGEDGFGRVSKASEEAEGEGEEDGMFMVGGKRLRECTPEAFCKMVDEMEHYEVIRLRVWAVLLGVVTYKLAELVAHEPPNNSTDDVDPVTDSTSRLLLTNEAAPSEHDHPHSPKDAIRTEKVRIFREGLKDLLVGAVSVLQGLQETWAGVESVQGYLRGMQEEREERESDGNDGE